MFCKNEGLSLFGQKHRSANRREQQRLDREEELLDLAEQIMEVEGFSGFTMDKLVSACGYSKGTVYNHFSCKEDLFCALCIRGMTKTLELFNKALSFDGNCREKVLAIHFAYRLQALTNPTQFMCVLTAQTPAMKEKANEQRLKVQQDLDNEMTHFCDTLFQQAIESGEIPGGTSIEEAIFASWALSFGTIALMTQASGTLPVERADTEMALLCNVNLLMDGMGWSPLSTEWDYESTWHRIAKQVFTHELEQLALRKSPG